ncbi:AraC family transcriptional regulator [Salegentibacter sp. LM13S]|uniref:helix-turn-helix domain-containing protein n=1 Tax=Salegentibacter lacus TaxID=2873599 RepID=UPI001CCAD2EA|nr:AraC family transcriptional regulator [Salegentibacter lacus]MBZ9629793.1 AraC family transcriptional regulator [Salegentibacter lacus]
MERELTRESLAGVHRMLYEIAKGNFAYQIKRTNHRDELEGLIALLNITVQKLNKNRNQFLWFKRYNEIVTIRTSSFLLSNDLKIIDYKWEGSALKKNTQSLDIRGNDFEMLLMSGYRRQWRKDIQKFIKGEPTFIKLLLRYEFYKHLEIKQPSVLTKVGGKNEIKFIVTSSYLDIQKDELFNVTENSRINKISIWNQQLFRNIEEYILDHIKEPPRKNYELARIFNTNEHKIKTGFKKVVGLTPAQYHKKHRIIQSKILIENTDYSLQDIAVKMGFKTYPKFSRYFKREVKMTPKGYRKRRKNPSI